MKLFKAWNGWVFLLTKDRFRAAAMDRIARRSAARFIKNTRGNLSKKALLFRVSVLPNDWKRFARSNWRGKKTRATTVPAACLRLIRRAAGLGALSMLPDPDHYDRSHGFCDLLVIGAGPAGLAFASPTFVPGTGIWPG